MTVLKKKWNNEILVEMTYANIAHIYYEMMHICWCRRYFFRIVSAQSHYAAAEIENIKFILADWVKFGKWAKTQVLKFKSDCNFLASCQNISHQYLAYIDKI